MLSKPMWVEVAKDSEKIGPFVLCYLTNRKYSVMCAMTHPRDLNQGSRISLITDF
jgi:hypothetical protein